VVSVVGCSSVVVAGGATGFGRGCVRGGEGWGRVEATVPGCSVLVVVAVFGRVKFVVVSTFVSVIVELVSGAAVSPGALIVDVTPFAEPS
jgi:hypothetical protein